MNTETVLDTQLVGCNHEAYRESTRSRVVLTQTDGVDMSLLIGKRHLFGRVKQLRKGLLVEPIGVLTLQPDGKIVGASHPNEGKWIPYVHGSVDAGKAFAFISADNNWIPSSTWTQSMGGMPIGYSCNDVDITQSAQRLCLIPHTPLPSETVITYLVASCLGFYERTVPKLLAQLFSEGIEPSRIKVVVNGCSHDYNSTIDGIDYAFSTHNAWEWSALYEAPLRWSFDYCFLIHDTSMVFAGFRRSVEEINGYLPWDYLPAAPMGRCLLGLYSHDYLMHCNEWLSSINHIDKQNGVIAEVAGELLLRARSALMIGDPEYNGAARPAEWRETVDLYGTGSLRIRRVFPAVKVHKFIHTGPSSSTSL